MELKVEGIKVSGGIKRRGKVQYHMCQNKKE